jgi:2-polyprenyl-6-methoxyphenol hydroxylase-like FAD-dependent oxidoreductase
MMLEENFPVDVPVLIAGGGPVGVTLAMELALHGVKSIIIEQRRDLSPSPRCNTTNARSMEIFRRLGCADAVRAAGLPSDFNTDVVYMTRMNGHELTRYERPTTDDVRAGTMAGVASDWPTPEPQHFISQLFLEPVLRDHARGAYGIDLREGWELIDFTQDEDGVSARARDVESGAEQTFRARYLVGSDGGRSVVRREIGARLEGIPEINNACTIFFEAPRLSELYRATPGWMYRFAAGGVLVAIDGKDRWLLHLNRPAGRPFEDGFDPREAIFAAIGEPFDYQIINEVHWTARALVADTFRDRRVFLAGDAAHIWVPMGGFGMNAGVGDAVTLGWMLGGVVAGWLDPKILDAYQAERAPLGAAVASQAARWSRDIFALLRENAPDVNALEADPAAMRKLGDAIRAVNLCEFENSGMQFGFVYIDSPIVAYDGTEPPPFTLEEYRETSSPGARAPHVVRAATKTPLFDEFGPAFTLLRIGPNPPDGSVLVADAARRGLPLTTVDVPEAEAVRAYEGYGLVLVRPDGHIAWRSRTNPDDARAVLDRVTGVAMETSDAPERHRAAVV